MSVAEKTCRTCGKAYLLEDEKSLCPLYDDTTEYENEVKMALEEFEVWNLEISKDDGLPQKICLTCFDSFCQIHNFRLMCIEAQLNFSEMCTGLDIIIKDEPSDEFSYENEQLGEPSVIIQEHYTFPGDEHLKTKEPDEQYNNEETLDSPPEANEDETNDIDDPSPENNSEQIENIGEEKGYVIELKEHRCEYCMGFVSFDDPDDLNNHYNEMHSTNLPYQCSKCDLRFDKKVKRNSHARCHYSTIPKECHICGKKFRGDDEMMAQHIAYYHVNKTRQCKICLAKFDYISLHQYSYHKKWHNDSELFKCKFCNKKFIQMPHLTAHEKTHAGEAQFVCKECGMGFKTDVVFKRHKILHEKNELMKCPKCPKNQKKYFTTTGLKLHDQKTHALNKEPSICKICDKTFPYPNDLRMHNYKKHDGPTPQIYGNRLAKPNINDSSGIRVLKRREPRPLIKPYKCEKCDEKFVLEIQLTKHVKIHEENRPYPCKYCSKAFKRLAHLRLHVNNIHLHKRPHKCTQCKAAFVQRSHLFDHIRIVHQNEKNHECDVCHKKFGTAQVLKMHKVIHSDERPYKCKLCGKGFKQLMVLKSHMTYMHLWKSEEAERRRRLENERNQNVDD